MGYVGKWFGFGKNERFDKGVRAYEASDYLQAAEDFRQVSQSETNLTLRQRAKSYLAGALGRLGKQAMAQGDYVTALKHLSEAVVLRPRYADLHMSLAVSHDALGEFSKRNEEVEAALRINPKYGFAVLFQASLLMASGDHANGLARAVQAVSLDRRLETDLFRSAVKLADEARWDEAAQTFRQVRAINQEDPDSLSMRGDRMMNDGRYEDASEAFRNALDLGPGYADLHVRYGQALLETNQVQQAADEFREAVTLNADYAEAHALLGIAYRRLGDERAAVEAFRRALEIDPNQVIAAEEIVRRRSL